MNTQHLEELEAIALIALPAVLPLCTGSNGEWDTTTVSMRCYELAQAMIEERERQRRLL